jgi:PAS domain S-box-containing protein
VTKVKRFGFPLQLKGKTILAMVLVGLLPLVLSLLLTYFEEKRALREAAGITMKGIAVEVARKVETQIIRGINEAQQLATIPFIRSAVINSNRSYMDKNDKEIQALIQEWQDRWRAQSSQDEFPVFINKYATDYLTQWHAIRKSDYLAIVVVDNEGALVLSSFPQVGFFHGKSLWWQAVMQERETQAFVSDLSFDPGFGTHVLNVAVPIWDDDRQNMVGAISILLRRDSLFRSISEVAAGKTGHAMLVTTDGIPLLCPTLSLEEHDISASMVGAFQQNLAGWLVADPDSHGAQHAIVGYAQLHLGVPLASESFGGKSWQMLASQDPAETYAPLDQLLIKVLSYGVAVFVVLWGAGILVAGRIVKPIQALSEGVEQFGSGNLVEHIDIRTGDEIERLAETFNGMAGNLQRSFSQLNQKVEEIGRLEEKYRDLIENAPEMIHQLDPSGRFVHVNSTELQKLGYSLSDMLTMSLWDIVPTEHQATVRAYVQGLALDGARTIETVFRTQSQKVIEVEIHSTTLVDPETHSIVFSRGFVRDITDRKALQGEVARYTNQLEDLVTDRTQQLSDSEAGYKALFNLAADSIFVVDLDGQVVDGNARARDILGYASSDLAGESFVKLVSPDFQETSQNMLERVSQGEPTVPTTEIETVDRHGTIKSMEMDLVRIDMGPRSSIMVQLRDITEHKRLEVTLQRYNEALEEKVVERTREIEQAKVYIESLLENANDVIYTLDVDLRFTYVNGKVEAWGYRKEDLIGKPYLSLLSKRFRSRYLQETLDMGEKQVYEVEIMSGHGELRSVLVSVAPLLNDAGGQQGVLGIARDITERKQLEQQVQNSERLASIGQLAAGVAHEINNPLGGILNCLYNIQKGTLTPERSQEYLHFMEDGLRRVQRIVRQLLDFSQQRELELALADLHHILDRVVVLTEHVFVERHAVLKKNYDETLPSLLVDGAMIEQVIMNLVLNAVQSLQQGGHVSLETRKHEEVCEIIVEDNGCGIASNVRPHIFDPFFTTKGTGEGTGLGLSVSLGIVQRHGGEMLVESEEGKGTRFTVRLPFARSRMPSMVKVGS